MTDMKDQLSACELSNDKLRALMMVGTDAFYMMSPDWRTLQALDGRGFIGHKSEPDANWLDQYVLSEDQPYVRSAIDKCIREGSVFDLEHRFRRTDGSIGWTHSRAVPHVGPSGELEEWLGVASDITDRKRLEEELRRSREHQEFLLKLSDAIKPLADPVEVQGVAVRLLGEHLGANRAHFGETEGDVAIIHQGYGNGLPPMVGRTRFLNFGERLIVNLRAGRTAVSSDIEHDPAIAHDAAENFSLAGFHAFIAVPLVKQGSWVALLAVHSIEPRAWTSEEVTLVEDVAERTWAAVERAKAESEKASMLAQVLDEREKLHATINSIEDEVWISDEVGNMVMLNPAAQLANGLQAEGKALFDILEMLEILEMDGTPRKPEKAPVYLALHGETASGEEIIRHLKTGELRYRRYTSAPIKDQQGNITGTVTVSKDITEAKRAEVALRESESRHAFLLKLSDALRSLSNPNDIHAVVTNMARQHYDSDRCFFTEIKDKSALVQQDSARDGLPSVVGVYSLAGSPIVRRLINAGHPFKIPDVRTTGQIDEKIRDICIRTKIISFLIVPVVKANRTVGMLCVTQGMPRKWTDADMNLGLEIAERTWSAVAQARSADALRESEARARDLVSELEIMDRNKNRFISVLSHELRNPLATIVMTQALLKRISPDSEQARRATSIQERQTMMLSRMVDDLLDVTRISENKIRLKLEQIDLVAVTHRAVEDIREAFEEKGVLLGKEMLADPIWFEGDAVRLAQSLGNLLHNALKFTRHGDAVTVSVSTDRSRNEAIIRVADTGEGIEPDVLDQMFHPFTQAEQSLARTQGGLGLGLSIAKGMVELHGGHIEAESDGNGKGATFIIRLPLA